MKFTNPNIRATAIAGAALALAACGHVQITHVAPGQSLGVALSRKADLVRMPTPPPGAAAPAADRVSEPNLHRSDMAARVAEAFSKGEFCMSTGNDEEAIKSFQDVVKMDPNYSEAWQRLAALYEKQGDSKKAIDAFRRAKKIARE